MKKIVVFGATGNIGIYLVEYLINHLSLDEYMIFAVGRKDNASFFSSHGVSYIRMDISQKNDFDKLPNDDVYAVINLAGILPAYLQEFEPNAYLDVNIYGGVNVLEYCRKVDADRIIFTQSWADLAGYLGKEEVLHPYMERSLVFKGDHAFYSITKCMIVDTMRYYKEEFGLKFFVFRLPNIYLYNPMKYYYVNGEKKVISYRYLIERAQKGEDIELWGDPNAFKDIIYVKDLCQMMFLAIFSESNGGIYNAGTGVKTTFLDQIQGIIDVFSPEKGKSKIIFRPDKESFPSFVMDISNAKEDLGYLPKYLYKEYLEDYKVESQLKRFDELWK